MVYHIIKVSNLDLSSSCSELITALQETYSSDVIHSYIPPVMKRTNVINVSTWSKDTKTDRYYQRQHT